MHGKEIAVTCALYSESNVVTYTEQKENDVHKSNEFVTCFIKHDRHLYTFKRMHSALQVLYCPSAKEFLRSLKHGETENSLSFKV